MNRVELSIVVLTRNRIRVLVELLESLICLRNTRPEIIVVDNGSTDGTIESLRVKFPRVDLIPLQSNLGAVARNFGLQKAIGNIIITLDDDVIGLTEQSLLMIERQFQENHELAALNFKVLDPHTGIIPPQASPRP